MTEPHDRDMAQLLRSLELAPLEPGRFRGPVEQDEGRLFGGLVLAQSVMAAGLTVAEGTIHSLHAYFLRAGRPATPIDYGVESIRDGRNFTTRRVTAVQQGDTIFEASIGFVRPEVGISFQQPMPEAPDPEGLPSWWESIHDMAEHLPPHHRGRRWTNPIDIRSVAAGTSKPGDGGLPRRMVWARTTSALPESPLIHAAAMVYMSDSGMVGTVGSHYGAWAPGGASASLDHTMWWHHQPRFDDWLLYVTESPAAHAARALTLGSIYTREGVLVASVAQEALFRRPLDRG
jgi:acyl-CoA thioesterase-2